ncbi:MAG: hypothetical protein ACYDDF_13160 [Thermoplasmatota archaeon]
MPFGEDRNDPSFRSLPVAASDSNVALEETGAREFTTLPWVRVQAGRIVDRPSTSPSEELRAIARAHGELVIVDDDGLRGREPALELYQQASRSRSMWIDAGSRRVGDIADLFVAGASRVTARWNLVHDLDAFEDAAAVSDSLYLGLEIASGSVLAHRRAGFPAGHLANIATEAGTGIVFILRDLTDATVDLLRSLASDFSQAPERWVFQETVAGAPLATAEGGFQGAILPLGDTEARP